MRRLPLRSPLRMRGKGPDDRAHPLVPGITPACAGKSWTVSAYKDAYRDHPRVCGEKRELLQGVKAQKGSPPRVRGKVTDKKNRSPGDGITPACAGKS